MVVQLSCEGRESLKVFMYGTADRTGQLGSVNAAEIDSLNKPESRIPIAPGTLAHHRAQDGYFLVLVLLRTRRFTQTRGGRYTALERWRPPMYAIIMNRDAVCVDNTHPSSGRVPRRIQHRSCANTYPSSVVLAWCCL